MKTTALERLSKVCRTLGKGIPHWTQGPGGNVSLKTQNSLWIKASGVRLERVGEDKTLAKTHRNDLISHLNQAPLDEQEAELYYAEALKNCAVNEPGLGRPSMEAAFHALLPRKWVAHFHSLASVLMSHHYFRDPSSVQAWFRSQTSRSVAFLPALQPGLHLYKALHSFQTTEIILLQNHGVILQADAEFKIDQGLLMEWSELEKRFSLSWQYPLLCDLLEGRSVSPLPPAPVRIYFPDTAVFFDRLQKVLSQGLTAGNEVVYPLHSHAFEIDQDAAELWLATQLLYQMCPSLEELPASISEKTSHLPVEIFRKRVSSS